jgi:CheY-like chemotaxis protein
MPGRLFLVMFGGDAVCRACDLRDAGWFVDAEFEDGGQAFRVIRAEPPDAVIIDLDQRPSHGREVARALRKSAATRALPLIFVGGEDAALAAALAIAPEAACVTWESLSEALAPFVPQDEG